MVNFDKVRYVHVTLNTSNFLFGLVKVSEIISIFDMSLGTIQVGTRC